MTEQPSTNTILRHGPFGPSIPYETPLRFHLKDIKRIDEIVGKLTEKEIAEIHEYIFSNGKPIQTPGQNDLAFIDTLMSTAGDPIKSKPDTSRTVPTLESLQQPLKQAEEIRAFLYETILGPEPKPIPRPKEDPKSKLYLQIDPAKQNITITIFKYHSPSPIPAVSTTQMPFAEFQKKASENPYWLFDNF